jgi:phosphate starvation-inducible PhoH-like protein
MKLATRSQRLYYDCIIKKPSNVIVGVGPAGVGKTFIPTSIAAEKLLKGEISRIVITRPIITLDENPGFLPGDIKQKMLPFLKPIYDILLQYMSTDRMRTYLKNENIEICPFSYMRGRTLSNCFIIADETQNTTTNQMKTLLTRIGENSTIVVTGDITQSDLCKTNNGLKDLLFRIEKQFLTQDESCIDLIKFGEEDVVRSEIVKKIMHLYEMY